ncbi:hypothetical protein Zm00014a_007816 [Zea mays]|uniref:Mono-/di-acylglycerol lipase N-terminal n=1 Tax=Zea mays TaxID=4577 RepID=A0A3L6ED32_MAIZE|nr:hypothetical protein Zm00014a_007816 [Zea mays]
MALSLGLDGPEVRQELILLLRYLKQCMYFLKKPYSVFLDYGGYGQNDVLIKKSKARILKPAFTIVCDRSSQCFLLFIRGAISVKERLTAATGAEVPFHHVVVQEGRVSNLVLGYAHCGMVVAARWIAKQAIPCLSKAIEQFPEYEVKQFYSWQCILILFTLSSFFLINEILLMFGEFEPTGGYSEDMIPTVCT